MNITLPPPLAEPPAPQSFARDFKLLLGVLLRVNYNKIRHWPLRIWLGLGATAVGVLSVIVFLGVTAYGALRIMPSGGTEGFLALIFMFGVSGQLFFGVTAAFVTLYMSEDLELLFVSPVPLRVVFAVKSSVVGSSNLLPAFLFCFLPAIFYGLLFQAGTLFYVYVLLIGCGLWIIGTALAVLINLVVMRLVPPQRGREAIGVIGAFAGILIALTCQLPNIIMHGGQKINITDWLAGQETLWRIMGYFPWGWGARALVRVIAGDLFGGLGWSLLLLLTGIAMFLVAFMLLERGFRQGWLAVSQGGGARRKRRRRAGQPAGGYPSTAVRFTPADDFAGSASPLLGMWAVAKKDLLYVRRDTREWFGYMMPLVIMVFFIAQFLFFRVGAMQSTVVTVLIMYSVMFSGNMALQSFGREGESEWFLNSVPLAGWPVVWGKLLGAAMPTLVLMEALALKVSISLTLVLAMGAVLLTLGASALGLFYSINNCRYNPDSPQQRISPGASLLMYIINLLFMLALALGMVYLMPPVELLAALPKLLAADLPGGPAGILFGMFSSLGKALLWPPAFRIPLGLTVVLGTWVLVFFGFMAATVRQSRKGFRVEIVTGSKRK